MQVGPQRRLFLCSIEQTVREICTFRFGGGGGGGGSLYEFLCLCFGFGPAPRLFTKSVKVPVSILRKLYIRIIVYLDDFLILGKTLEETILSRDTVIYLLQNLGFVINLKKAVLHPTQRTEFLGMIIDSVEMTVSLPQEKVESISKRYQYILSMQEVSIKDLAKFLGALS